MKSLTIIGAMAGFVIGGGGCLLNGGSTKDAFWHASLTALGAAWIARWCGNVWFESLIDSMAEAARKRHEAEENAPKPVKK